MKMSFVGLLIAGLFSMSVLADHGGMPIPGQPLVIDVRTDGEYQQEHIRQAVNIPYDEIAARIDELAPDPDTAIVLYCRSGRRSGIAKQTLRQLGYQEVTNQGGLSDMIRDGYRTD